MRYTIITLLIAFLFVQETKGQDNPALRLHIQGYNLVFPGMEIAYQYPLYTFDLNKEKENKLVFNIAPVVDIYAYRGNHTGIGFVGELNLQYIFPKGYIVESYGGYGFLEAILWGKVYELNDNGVFESSRLKGNIYSNWKTGFGFGKLIELKSGKKISLNCRGGIRRAKTPGAFIVPNISGGISLLFNSKKKNNE